MSYSTCVVKCNQCGNAAGVDLSCGLCTECRVMKRRDEDAMYPRIPNIAVPNTVSNPIKYYVVVDSGYEHQTLTGPGTLAQPGSFTGELIALNHKSTKPTYDVTVNVLFEVIPTIMQMKYQRQFTNHPIFKVNDINADTINKIIDAARSMEYNEIWGNGMKMVQYPIADNVVLVHLQLNEVESG